MRINLYGQNRHLVLVDGVPLSGFADGDYITVKADGNAATRVQGGDGPSMNLTVAQGGTITINLFPTSPSMPILYALRANQKNAPRLFSIVVVSGVEEIINAQGCAFGELPQFQTGGPTMQARSFTFECLQVSMDLTEVEPVGGGFLGGLI